MSFNEQSDPVMLSETKHLRPASQMLRFTQHDKTEPVATINRALLSK